MDLGCVQKRLKSGYYENLYHFAEEVRLVWNNAKKFNPNIESFVHKLAIQYEEVFEQEFAKIPRVDVKKVRKKVVKSTINTTSSFQSFNQTPHQPSYTNNTPIASSNWSNSVPRKRAKITRQPIVTTPAADVSAIYNEFHNIKAELAQMKQNQRLSNNRRGRPIHSSHKKEVPLASREKRILKQSIMQLTPLQIQGVMKILKIDGENENVVIDMDKIETATLRKLQDYVKRTLAKNKRQVSTSSIRRPSSGHRRPSSGHRRPSSQDISLASASPNIDTLTRSASGAPIQSSPNLPMNTTNYDESDSSDSDIELQQTRVPRTF